MKHKHLLLLSSAAFVMCALGQPPPGPTPVTKPLPWAMDHSNPARTGWTGYSGPIHGQIAWQRKVAGSVSGLAVDPTGRVSTGAFFATDWWSNEMFAERLQPNGEIDFKTILVPYDWGAGQGVKSGPAIDTRGSVTFNSSYGQIVTINALGDVARSLQRSSSMTNDSSVALMPDGTIFHYQGIGGLTKYVPSGSIVWQTALLSQTDVAVAPNGDLAMGGLRTNEPHGSTDLTYLNPDGTVRWRKTSSNGSRPQVCFGPDGILYTGSAAYNPDGTLKWTAAAGGWGACLDKLGRVLVPSGSTLHAFNATNGATVWSLSLPYGSMIVEGVSIDGKNRIFLTTSDGWFYGVNTNGTIFMSLKPCDQFTSQPAIGPSNTAFAAGLVGFDDYYIFKIQ